MENNSATDQMNTELQEVFTEVLKKFADRTGNNFKYLNYNGFTANFDESGASCYGMLVRIRLESN